MVQERNPFAATTAGTSVGVRCPDRGRHCRSELPATETWPPPENLRFVGGTGFYAEFGTTIAKVCAAFGRRVAGRRRDDMKLYVGNYSAVQFPVRSGARPAVGGFGVHGREAKFPMLIIHRLRVVRDEAWPGPYRQRPEHQQCQRQPHEQHRRCGLCERGFSDNPLIVAFVVCPFPLRHWLLRETDQSPGGRATFSLFPAGTLLPCAADGDTPNGAGDGCK